MGYDGRARTAGGVRVKADTCILSPRHILRLREPCIFEKSRRPRGWGRNVANRAQRTLGELREYTQFERLSWACVSIEDARLLSAHSQQMRRLTGVQPR